MFQITCGADVAIMHVFDARISTLPDDFRSEIDFVMRRPNARTQLQDQIGSFAVEALFHQRDRFGNNSELCSFFPGMHQTDDFTNWIEEENSAAICDVNSETNVALVGHQSVASVETTIN